MESIDIAGLEGNAAAIIKKAHDNMKVIHITQDGEFVARIVPSMSEAEKEARIKELQKANDWPERLARQKLDYDERRLDAMARMDVARATETEEQKIARKKRAAKVIAEGDRIAADVAKHLTGPVSAVELVREGRRDFDNVRD